MTVIAALIAFGVMFILALLGVPLAAAMGLGGIAGMLIAGIPLAGIPVAVMSYLGNYAWIALPLFVMLGGLLSDVGVSRGIVWFGELIRKRIRGGTSQVVIVTSLFLGGMTGSMLAEAGMLSAMFRKEMEKIGYPKGYLAGLISCAGLIGALIPPSNILLILGLVGEISIIRLWMAGVVPGLMIGIGMMIVSVVIHKRYKQQPVTADFGHPVSVSGDGALEWARQATFITALPGLAVPIFLLTGMRFGIFTPVEAGAAGIIFALILSVTVYRSTFDIGYLTDSITRNMLVAMSYLYLVAGSAIFGVLIVRLNLTATIEAFFIAGQFGFYEFMLVNFSLFFIMGMFMEAVPIMLIFFPLMLPAAKALGIDPIHFGVAFSMIILLANLTPPIGIQTLFVCRLMDTTIGQWWRHGKHFFLVVVIVALLTILVPGFSLTLPNLIMN